MGSCQVCAELLEWLEAMAQASHPNNLKPGEHESLVQGLARIRAETRTSTYRLAAATLRQLQGKHGP